MNDILRKIANTVIANLDNTTEIGLFKGRMGLTIFYTSMPDILVTLYMKRWQIH